MAIHISSVATSGLPGVTKDDFYSLLTGGDLVFCSGRDEVSIGIERMTDSPFSHVLMAWLPAHANQWLTIEATMHRGVHVGKLSDYVDGYNGDLVLTRRPVLTDQEKIAALNAGFAVLEDGYDWQQEVSIVAHKLISALPVIHPDNKYYCSGLMYLMSLASGHPLQKPGPNLPTPEDNWTDATVLPVCAMLHPAKPSEAIGAQRRVA